MKNSQKGFIVPALLVVIALLVIGVGVYIYENKKTEVPTVNTEIQQPTQLQTNTQTPPTTTQTTNQPITSNPTQQTNPSPTKISVAGMKQYTDLGFGFLFWYPSVWTVENVSISNQNAYPGGIIQKRLNIYKPGGTAKLIIDEYYSADKTITINSTCDARLGCSTVTRYYFDSNAHTWIVQYPEGSPSQYSDKPWYITPGTTKAADVSANTMGGLHILVAPGPIIVPLSATKFLVMSSDNLGALSPMPLVTTIVASDPNVATPKSIAEQTHTVQVEGQDYGFSTLPPVTITSVSSVGLPGGQIYSGEKFSIFGPEIKGCEMVRPQSCDVEIWVGGKLGTFVSDPNQLTFTAPQLTPGVYNLYLVYPTTGVKSQTLQVKVLSR